MSRFLSGIHLNGWILSVTPIFLAAFVALLFFVYQKSRKGHYERMGALPFENGNEGAHVSK